MTNRTGVEFISTTKQLNDQPINLMEIDFNGKPVLMKENVISRFLFQMVTKSESEKY